MKTLLLGFSFLAAMSSFAFANPVTDTGPQNNKKEVTECWFGEDRCDGKGNCFNSCKVRLEEEGHHNGGHGALNKDELKMKVECRNGFDLFDRDANACEERREARDRSDDETFIGKDDGKLAILIVSDNDHHINNDGHHNSDRATLIISARNGFSERLEGRCKEKKDDHHGDDFK